MTSLIIIAIIVLCILLGFFILVQQPKGGGLSGAFGSMGAQVMGVQKSGDAMEKGTWYTMALIAILSIASVFTLNLDRSARGAAPASQQEQQQSAPAATEEAPLQSVPADATPMEPAE